jgi:hypothetical protein
MSRPVFSAPAVRHVAAHRRNRRFENRRFGCAGTYKPPNPLRHIRVEPINLSVGLRHRSPPHPLGVFALKSEPHTYIYIRTQPSLLRSHGSRFNRSKQAAEMLSGLVLDEYTVEGTKRSGGFPRPSNRSIGCWRPWRRAESPSSALAGCSSIPQSAAPLV